MWKSHTRRVFACAGSVRPQEEDILYGNIKFEIFKNGYLMLSTFENPNSKSLFRHLNKWLAFQIH